MTMEVNCMNCMIGRFKDDLCDGKMCEALKRIGNSDDFVDIIMLAKDIVRCKDCRWYSVKGKTTMYGWCDANWISVNETDYCSKGERKGGDDE